MLRKLSFFGHTFRDGGCELVKCVVQGKVDGSDGVEDLRYRTVCNIAKWMGGSTQRIALDGENW